VLAQVKKLRERFSLERVVPVGDRGTITSARIDLHGKALIGLRMGRVLGRFKMGKHFKLEIAEESLHSH
jgi:hypothetical protein